MTGASGPDERLASERDDVPGPQAAFGNAAKRYERRLLVVLFLGIGFVLFDRQAPAFLAPYINEEFGLSHSQLGLLSAALALTWAISGVLVGALSDRLGRRKPLLIAAVVLFSVFSAVSGFVGGFAALLLARALMGAAEGGVIPMSQSLMVEASRPSRRGLNMGLVQGASAGLLGGIAAPLLFVWLAESFGWRSAFFVTLIPGLVIAAAMVHVIRERPPQPVDSTTVSTEGRDRLTESAPRTHVAFASVLGMRNVVLCILIAVFFLTWFATLMTFTPSYLLTVKHWTPATMGVVMTCLGVAWMMWGFLAPAVSDRIGRKSALALFSGMAVLCPLAVIALDNPWLLGIALALTFTGVGCFTIFMAVIPAETVPASALATTVGVTMGAGEILGGTLGPVISGWASDRWGLQASMLIAAASAAVVLLLSLALRETAPRVLASRLSVREVASRQP